MSDLQGHLKTSMPSKESSAVPSHAPGKVIPSDAAGVLLPLTIDTLVRDSYMCTFPTQLCFNVVPPLVKALQSHCLTPIFEAIRVVWVAVLPGAGVGQLSIILLHM